MYLYFKPDRHCTLIARFKTQTHATLGPLPTGCSRHICSPVPQPLSPSLGCHQPGTAGQLELPPDGRKQPGTPKWHKERVPAALLVKPYRNTQTLLAALLTYFSHFQLKRTNKIKFYHALASHNSIHHLFAKSKKRSSAVFPLGQYFIGKARWSEEHFLNLSGALPANAWLLCHVKGLQLNQDFYSYGD